MICRISKSVRCPRGFTLVEVLITMLLIAIVLPATMTGIGMATSLASAARRRNEAAGLAQSKLAEIIATSQWQTGNTSGDFGTDWPDYKWDAQAQQWSGDTTGAGIEQVDLHVTWRSGRGPESVTVSTLVYARTTTTTTQ